MQKKSRINWCAIAAIIMVIIFAAIFAYKYFFSTSKPKISVETDQLSVCDKFPAINYYKVGCYVKFAIEKNDLSVCDRLEGKDSLNCNEMAKANIEYLNKNNIYINPAKRGDVKIITPKAGEILDKSKQYKITWATSTFSEKDTLDILIGEYNTGELTYLSTGGIRAKQGYYDFTPNFSHQLLDNSDTGGAFLKSDTKYFIYLDAGGDPNNDDLKLHGTSDLFKFK